MAFRRFYRQRNLFVHWGKTDAVAWNATLRTAAPFAGAGMDRIAHGWLVDGMTPTELAARARLGIDVVGTTGAKSPIDLLASNNIVRCDGAHGPTHVACLKVIAVHGKPAGF